MRLSFAVVICRGNGGGLVVVVVFFCFGGVGFRSLLVHNVVVGVVSQLSLPPDAAAVW